MRAVNVNLGAGAVLALVGVVAAFFVVRFAVQKGQQAAAAVGGTVAAAVDAINPANNDNIIARGVNSVVQTVSGSPSLGSLLFDIFGPAEPDLTAPTPISGGSSFALSQSIDFDISADSTFLGAP